MIVVTAETELDAAIRCYEKGAHDYLTKPFRTAELLRVVKNATALAELLRKSEILDAWQDHAQNLPPPLSSEWRGLEMEAKALVAGYMDKETPSSERFRGLLSAVEKQLILRALSHCNWNQTHASAWLGIQPNTLAAKMKLFGIPGIRRPKGLRRKKQLTAGSAQ